MQPEALLHRGPVAAPTPTQSGRALRLTWPHFWPWELMSGVLRPLAQTGRSLVHSAYDAVTLLDVHSGAPTGAFSAPRLLDPARRGSRRRGVISARSRGTVFAGVRPGDVVLHHVVDNRPMGEDLPVFEILACDADGTDLLARRHEQCLGVRDSSRTRTGGVSVLGSPVDVFRTDVPTFVTGAVDDHVTPWTGRCRTSALRSGPSTFVLSGAGHTASLIDPPGGPQERHPPLEPGTGAHVLDREPVSARGSSAPSGRRS